MTLARSLSLWGPRATVADAYARGIQADTYTNCILQREATDAAAHGPVGPAASATPATAATFDARWQPHGT